ncbi:MAG TPA: (2Fe-2S)-binding protein [Paracoccaceae bacterium]|nr:(2Fe-2S)-binding protein [Paracoccaceae bacterium]HMO71829.1 (2Fe-2S)-binding protein [Paracoccaceae bacterium]
MIVCHCMSVTDHDIRAAVAWMRAADAATIITPGKVYRALGRRADCGGCLPLFLDTLRTADGFAVPRLRAAAPDPANARDDHEGRHQGHRISERGAAV